MVRRLDWLAPILAFLVIVGIAVAGPTSAEYLTSSACASCSAERLATDVTNETAWDFGTAGQAKLGKLGFNRPNYIMSYFGTCAFTQGMVWTGAPAVSTFSAGGGGLSDHGYLCTDEISGTSGVNGYHAQAENVIYPGRSAYFSTWLTVQSTVDTRYLFGFGPADLSSDDITAHLAWFRWNGQVDSTWQCITNDNSGGGTISDSGVTAPDVNGYHRFEIQETNATSWKFYIDGVLKCTNTTNMPTAGMKVVSGMWSLPPDGAPVGKQTGQGAIYAEQTIP